MKIIVRSALHRTLVQYGRYGPLTDHQAGLLAEPFAKRNRPEGYRRRASDLLKAGYIEVVGERRDPQTNRMVRVCRITPKGRKARNYIRRTHKDYIPSKVVQ